MLRPRRVAAYIALALFNCALSPHSNAHTASQNDHSAARRSDEQTGLASFYGNELHGRKTASGRRFDERGLTAASLVLPLNSRAEVTSLRTGLSVTVTITDRGPFAQVRVIDLSKAAAEQIGITSKEGIGLVVVRPVRLPPHHKQTIGD